MQLKKVQDADIAGKRIIMRVDANVPVQNGVIGDDFKIRSILPTLELLKQKGAAHITLMTHWGRPGGVDDSLRTAPLFARLGMLTDTSNMDMLENVRFDPREESNDADFAKELAQNQDMYVNDAFAVCHRSAASVVGVAKLLPSYAGLLVQKEVQNLGEALTPPPGAVAIMCGAKLETKLPLIHKLLPLYEKVLVGGALANELLTARGTAVHSIVVSDTPVPADIASNEHVVSPTDLVVKTAEGENVLKKLTDIVPSDTGFDIGSQTEAAWSEIILRAPFILWNGPTGWFEGGYTAGTAILAEALTKSSARAVIGGGNTVDALSKFTFDPSRVFISTGGGAMLEFITAGTLFGLEPLRTS